MLNRREILKKAVHDCMCEMYKKAQPSADLDQIIEDYKAGKIGKDERVYERYYLSQEEFLYIRDKYKEAYRIKEEWKPNIEVLEKYLVEGGLKDKYIPEEVDEDGMRHPGYRSSEKVPPLKELILDIMKDFDMSEAAAEVGEQIYDKVMETIKNCKDFYMFDREERDFDIGVALGASPTSNPGDVKKWWKENKALDIEIEERNPLLFWEKEYYGDEFEEVMKDEYGDNWKEIWDKKWKDEVEQKKKDEEQRFKEFCEKYNKENNEDDNCGCIKEGRI